MNVKFQGVTLAGSYSVIGRAHPYASNNEDQDILEIAGKKAGSIAKQGLDVFVAKHKEEATGKSHVMVVSDDHEGNDATPGRALSILTKSFSGTDKQPGNAVEAQQNVISATIDKLNTEYTKLLYLKALERENKKNQ